MGATASINSNNNTTTATTTKDAIITPTQLQQWVETVAKLNINVGLTPIVLSQLAEQLMANDEAMNFLTAINKEMGFVKADAFAVRVEAKLPPELENFNVLKEEKNVAAALQDKSFVRAQEAVQEKSNDAAALAALQTVVANAHEVCNLKHDCKKWVLERPVEK
jgi:hypothetical protein